MKVLLFTFLFAKGADTSTSLVAFNHGAIEANPLILSSRPAPFVAQMAIGAAGELWLIRKLNHAGHPKWARVIGWSMTGASIAASAKNLRVIQQANRRIPGVVATEWCNGRDIVC